MADAGPRIAPLLSAEDIACRVEDLAERLAPGLSPDAVGVVLLIGGLWFAADLTRALAGLGRPIAFDGLWLASYGDRQTSAGRCEVRAGLQRPVQGRQVLLIDDVSDSGLSLAEARRLMMEAGAAEVITAVFARKPWPERTNEPDHVAWEAPSRFLVGYGMDIAGAWRGLPYIGAVDEPEGASHCASGSRESMSS
jgi:hypoxanthine phosphoribosyltransferase